MKILTPFILFFLTLNTFSQVNFIAHRGASYLAPENTLAAVNLAWKLDANAVEVDVFISQDSQIMVCHDDTTFRTSGYHLAISKSKAKLLRKLDVGSWKHKKFMGEKIPYLTEVINTIPEGKTLVVEIKCGSEILPEMKRIMDTTSKAEQIAFIGFGWETILDTKQMFPNNKCYWLSENSEGLKDKMKAAAKYKLDGINLYHEIIDSNVMYLARRHKLDVWCWTVDEPDEARRLAKLGVTGITTNRPAWLKAQIYP